MRSAFFFSKLQLFRLCTSLENTDLWPIYYSYPWFETRLITYPYLPPRAILWVLNLFKSRGKTLRQFWFRGPPMLTKFWKFVSTNSRMLLELIIKQICLWNFRIIKNKSSAFDKKTLRKWSSFAVVSLQPVLIFQSLYSISLQIQTEDHFFFSIKLVLVPFELAHCVRLSKLASILG
jgi:hypothetical protein